MALALPLPLCRLNRVRTLLWRCNNDARCPPCRSMLHHHEIYIEHTYRIPTISGCTQLRDWIWNADRGFRLVETGVQLQAGRGSFRSSHFYSIEKIPLITYFWVWGRGKQEPITRLHCIVQPFVHLHDVENPLLEVVKHADLHCMEEIGLWEVAHNTVNMSKNVESSVNMVRPECRIGCLGDDINEHSKQVVMPPWVLLVRMHIISKFVLWTLAT